MPMRAAYAAIALLLLLLLPLGPVDASGFSLQPRSLRLIPYARRLLQERSNSTWGGTRPQEDKWDRKQSRPTQGSTYSSQGYDPGDNQYYNEQPDGRRQPVVAGDATTPGFDTFATRVMSVNKENTSSTAGAPKPKATPESSSNRGTQTMATYGTFRAVAGSSSSFNAATKEKDMPWGMQAISANSEKGPTPGERVSVKDKKTWRTQDRGDENIGRGYKARKSVSFTNLPPNSAAQSQEGNGPAAIANGWEVAAAARAARDNNVAKDGSGLGPEGLFEKLKRQSSPKP